MENLFRRALIRRDLREVQRVVAVHADKHQLTNQEALKQLFLYVFEDDEGGSGLLYLAAGCRMSSKTLQVPTTPAAAAAARKRARFSTSKEHSIFNICAAATSRSSSSSSTICIRNSSACTSKADSSTAAPVAQGQSSWWFSSSSSSSVTDPDAGAAGVLAWVLECMSESPLDLTLVNARCQGVLHCCLLSGSTTVLQLLLQLPGSYPQTLKPSWTLEDASGTTPLNLAITLQNWRAVSAMLAAGAAGAAAAAGSSSSEMAAAQQVMAGLLPGSGNSGVSVDRSLGGSSSSSGLGDLLAGIVGRFFGGKPPHAEANKNMRKQQHDVAGEQLHPGSSGSSVLTFSEAAIAEQLQQAVQQVSHVTGVLPAAAMALLAANGYSTDRAIEATLQHQQQQQNGDDAAASNSSSGGDNASAPLINVANGQTFSAAAAAAAAAAGGGGGGVSTAAAIVSCSHAGSSSNQTGATAATPRRDARCIVCFEPAVLIPSSSSSSSSGGGGSSSASHDVPPGHVGASTQVPCGHITCDTCWYGIIKACIEDLGVQRAVCPAADCGAVLCLDDVCRLVGDALYQRYLSLLAQHVVNVSPLRRWCPAPGCGRSLQLQQPQQQPQQQQQQQQHGTAGVLAEQNDMLCIIWNAVQAGRGVDVECDCGCRFCWACQQPAHEPASCKQVLAWQQLLSQVAATAEESSESWVRSNTKPCPKCNSKIQKQGGCNHLTCKVCRQEWCWVCGRDWQEHSQDRDAYYHCNLTPTQSAATGSSSSNSMARHQQQGTGVLGSVLAAVKFAAVSHKQRNYIAMHSMHEVDVHQLHVLLRYQQLLLTAVLQATEFSTVVTQQQQQWRQQEMAPVQSAVGLKGLAADSTAAAATGAAAAATAAAAAATVAVATGSSISSLGKRSVVAAEQQPQQQHWQQQPHSIAQQQRQPQACAVNLQQQQQQLQALGFSPLSDGLLQQWLHCVDECKCCLRWACVLGFYQGSTASRRYLEHLQGCLAAPVEQLLAVAQHLPGAQQVLEATAAAAAAAAARSSWGLHGAVRGFVSWFWQLLGYSSTTDCTIGSGSTAADSALQGLWINLPTDIIQRQVYYVIAMSQQLQHVQQLIAQARNSQWRLLRAARLGYLEEHRTAGSSSSSSSWQPPTVPAAAAAQAAGVRGRQVDHALTALDMVHVATNADALADLVAAGAAQLWRSWTS